VQSTLKWLKPIRRASADCVHWVLYQPPLNPTLAPHVMAGLDPGLDPAIGYPHQIANDAIPVSNRPMEVAGSSPAMTWLD
jgi:hypothetical protein